MPDWMVSFRVRVTGVDSEGRARTAADALNECVRGGLALSLEALNRGARFEGDPVMDQVPTQEEELLAFIKAARATP